LIDFVENMPIDEIRGAQYNPRVITQDSLAALKDSLKKFGVVKPLIINAANNVIVAGHQRQKAAKEIGLTHLPCIRVCATKAMDEIRFNLLHNSIETSQNRVRLEEFKIGGYHYCPSSKIKIEKKPQNVLICAETAQLLSRFGEWGSVVTDGNGNVILNSEYAYSAKRLGYGVLVYAISDENVDDFMRCISVEYGKYNFDNLGIKTYHQFMAQMKRCSTDGRQQNKTQLYERYLMPNLQKTESVIDIGAGRMAYVKLLKSKGYDIHAYEPALVKQSPKGRVLDMKGIVANILDIEKAVKTNGLFDRAMLCFVINSIVDDDFEKAVMILCNAVLKSTGTLLTCTRDIAALRALQNYGTMTAGHSSLRCLDENGYALSISQGIAFKQKYHTQESYVASLHRFFESVEVLPAGDSSSIFCACTKPKQLPTEVYEEYLEKELNIEYPNGFKHNKHKGLMNALITKVADRYV